MTRESDLYIGIDVGKTWLDIARWGEEGSWHVTNDKEGVAKIIEMLGSQKPKLVAVEATGGYEQLVVQELMLREIGVAVVNPTRVRALSKATGKLAKTDVIDAHLIAEYAFKIQPEAMVPKLADEIRLQELVSRREQLVEMCVAEKNRLGTCHDSIKGDIRAHIEWMNTRIEELEDEIKCLVESVSEWKTQIERLDSIPGVGFLAAVTILVELPELGQLDRQKIAALAGLAPFNRDSGQKHGKRRIFGGRKGVRRVLYLACLSAIRCNPIISAMYQRLKERGKMFKVAITACMRKLLTIANAMTRDQVNWKIPVSIPD